MMESFNGTFRDACLDTHGFLPLADAEEKIGQWRHDYNHYRPYSSWGDMTPMAFYENRQQLKEDEAPLPAGASPLPMFPERRLVEEADPPKPTIPSKRNKCKQGPIL